MNRLEKIADAVFELGWNAAKLVTGCALIALSGLIIVTAVAVAIVALKGGQ